MFDRGRDPTETGWQEEMVLDRFFQSVAVFITARRTTSAPERRRDARYEGEERIVVTVESDSLRRSRAVMKKSKPDKARFCKPTLSPPRLPTGTRGVQLGTVHVILQNPINGHQRHE